MSFLTVENVKISGISACVPEQVEACRDFSLFSESEAEIFSKTTGVERRRKAHSNVCASDLCQKSAEELIYQLGWDKTDVDCLIFVTQTPDYYLPATSCVLQEKLGLSKDCYTLDVSLGCSGWVYALSVISSLMSHGSLKKGLLLSGDTILKFCSTTDKSTYPLFGDAGSATALEFTGNKEDFFNFSFNTDGSGYKAIMIEDGGFRNPVTENSFEKQIKGDGISRNKLELILEGMDVFSFGISKAPKSVKDLSEHFNLDLEKQDYFIFHQANLFMNEKIRKKLALPEEKVPYSLRDFGNTSSATIPLTMVTQIRQALIESKLSNIACGFGVGLSWGTCHFKTENIVCPKLIVY
ncbi:MAG: 3-oxoacyl-ACP synthase III family protein [Paludibacteraceae bacterium]